MAIIRFSTLTNNQTIAFNRITDVLLFDDASISAGAVSFNFNGTTAVSFTAQGS
jgi:transcriptional/translational regulatory protein YebC/TACO1